MWSKPWSYKEGLVIGAGLLVIGILLQMAVGAINWSLFACPVNVIVLVVYIIALVAMHLLYSSTYINSLIFVPDGRFLSLSPTRPEQLFSRISP